MLISTEDIVLINYIISKKIMALISGQLLMNFSMVFLNDLFKYK